MIKKFPTIFGHLYFGAAPGLEELSHIKDLGVNLIVNLAKEYEGIVGFEKKYVEEVIFYGIEDYSVPENILEYKRLINYVASILAENGKVYVHCAAGIGRTGTFLAGVKVLIDGLSPEKALEISQKYCFGPETEEQCAFVKSLTNTNIEL